MVHRHLLLILLLIARSVGPAHAQDDVAAFYRGKQVRLIVGTAPGGGYDLFARIVARHIAAHIPGQPTVIVQNLPAAGGLVMTNQLYALGPKDGTAIGVPINGIPTAPLLQQGAQFDATRLIWIGSTNREPYVAFVWHTAPVQSLAELRSQGSGRGLDHAGHHHDGLPAGGERHPRTEISRWCAATKARRRSTTPSSAAKSRARAASAGRRSRRRCRSGSPRRKSR